MYARSEVADAKIKSGKLRAPAAKPTATPTAKSTALPDKPPGGTVIATATAPKVVFICSPLRPTTKTCREDELEANLERAKKACGIAAALGFMPLAPHLYFTQFLDDEKEQQREKGMAFGMQWLEQSDEVWVFGSRVSSGMKAEIQRAEELGKTVRRLPEPGRLVELMLKEMLSENAGAGENTGEEGIESKDNNEDTKQPMAAESEEQNG